MAMLDPVQWTPAAVSRAVSLLAFSPRLWLWNHAIILLNSISKRFFLILVFQRTKKYKPCGVILDSYHNKEEMQCIAHCMSRDDCVRVISSQEDRICHLIGHQYASGQETCLSLDMTQWMKL